MLGLLPSVYGLAAAVAFAALSVLAFADDYFLEGTGLALLAVAYVIRYLPKFFVLSILNLAAHAAFLAGAALFAYSVWGRVVEIYNENPL